MKKIIILIPKNLKEGQPSYERISSFKNFYKNNNNLVIEKEQPSTILEKINLLKFMYKNNIKNIFISMPSFRNWFVFFIPFINVTLDIRDGWSIAIKSGYGGNVKPNKIKAFIATIFEKFAFYRAKLVIACTNGLKEYLDELTSKELLLITNGYSKSDFDIVYRLKKEVVPNKSIEESKIAVCAGQFSEYGDEKVKKILEKLNNENKKIIIKLIGSNYDRNVWIHDWIRKNRLDNLELQILERMNRKNMYKEIISADYGITVIRDPHYEFGTKVFDYILCEVPIFNYFDDENNFTNFFNNFLNTNANKNFNVSYLREDLIAVKKEILLSVLG